MISVPRFVLGSASPARLRLLRDAGLDPAVMVSGVDEDAITAATPSELVQALASAKAQSVARALAPEADVLVLGCDSLLDLDGRGLGKPADLDEARARWTEMAGRSGVLVTGHSLLRVRDGEVVARADAVASTTVRFGRPDPGEVEDYLRTAEPLQVAGAFTLDGFAAPFVEGIDGDHGTVLGLSLPLLRTLLAQVGVRITDLWASRA